MPGPGRLSRFVPDYVIDGEHRNAGAIDFTGKLKEKIK